MDQVTVPNERRYLIFDGFFRIGRRRLYDRYSDFLQAFLNLTGETTDVFIDISGFVWVHSLCLSTGRWLVWFGDADPVVGELRVHAGELNFRHVTRRAFVRTHGTCRRGSPSSLGFPRIREMTRKTLLIVIRRVLLQLLVWVVTTQTANPRIVRVVTATVEHPVRLKTNVVDA